MLKSSSTWTRDGVEVGLTTRDAEFCEPYETYYSTTCPPPTAETVRGLIYRFVFDGCTHDDFHTLAQKERESRRPRSWRTESERCMANGLSVYTSLQDARAAMGRLPAARCRIGENIACADFSILGPAFRRGKMERTSHGSGHHTWWPSGDCTSTCQLFSIVPREEGG